MEKEEVKNKMIEDLKWHINYYKGKLEECKIQLELLE